MTSTKRLSKVSSLRPANGPGGEGKLIILGVDPGSIVTGYGLVCAENGDVTPVKWGVIRAKRTDPIQKRLLTVYKNLIELIDTFHPHCVAVERAFYGSNVKSLIAMGQSVGVALLAAAEREVEVFEYTTRAVKKSVVGSGGASKEQIRRMVSAILGLGSPSEISYDATDALAVALCHEKRTQELAVITG